VPRRANRAGQRGGAARARLSQQEHADETVGDLDPPPGAGHVMSLLLVLIGLVSFDQLSLREYPRIDEPLVNVTTRLLGASSEVIESQVTKPLEDSIAGIDGVDIMTSISRTEQSQITVRFKLSKDPDTAAAEVRDRVARVRGRLPDAATSRSSPRSRPTPRRPSGWPTPARR
jgi:multidrug efflux pump subunit AcrB